VYTTDIGVLVAMLDYGTQADILKGNLLGYKGAIFENLMADFLCKSGQKLYYFHGLSLDFKDDAFAFEPYQEVQFKPTVLMEIV